MEYEEVEKHERISFWKGAAAGFIIAALVAAIGIGVFYIVNEQVQEELSAKDKADTASEVVVNSRIQRKLEKIADLIDEYYFEDVDTEELETYLYKGLVAGTNDLYSAYYSEDELKQFMEDTSGSYSGIGVTMQYDSDLNMVKIVKVNSKGSAAEVDIQVGDYIYKVDGEEIPLENADTSKIVSAIRGEEGTKVKLTLLRGDDRHEVEVEVERRSVEVETVNAQMLEDNIGYIQITEFEGTTASQFHEAYDRLKGEGAEGMIVDLRDNPGGQVDSVVDIAGSFLPEGIVTYMEDKNGNRQDYKCDGEDIWDKPLTVLINGNSASASEIFAGAVRDYKVGTLLGTKSFGKGIVQQTLSLGDNTAIKLTFAKYYTPNGENIHKKGIEPDVEVEYDRPEQEYNIENDNQVQAAIENIKEQMKQ